MRIDLNTIGRVLRNEGAPANVAVSGSRGAGDSIPAYVSMDIYHENDGKSLICNLSVADARELGTALIVAAAEAGP